MQAHTKEAHHLLYQNKGCWNDRIIFYFETHQIEKWIGNVKVNSYEQFEIMLGSPSAIRHPIATSFVAQLACLDGCSLNLLKNVSVFVYLPYLLAGSLHGLSLLFHSFLSTLSLLLFYMTHSLLSVLSGWLILCDLFLRSSLACCCMDCFLFPYSAPLCTGNLLLLHFHNMCSQPSYPSKVKYSSVLHSCNAPIYSTQWMGVISYCTAMQ